MDDDAQNGFRGLSVIDEMYDGSTTTIDWQHYCALLKAENRAKDAKIAALEAQLAAKQPSTQ
jgi:hypothetical protein